MGQDIVGPFELGTWDCRYAFTLVDNYSKWPEIPFTSNVITDTVIDFLATTFSRVGNLVEIVTDNGVQFASLTFAEFLTSRNIKHVRTSLYFPQANGTVERINRVLKDCVQTASLEGKFAKRAAKPSALRPGDRVHVRIPTHVKKSRLKFSPSSTVLGQKGQETYILDDGKVWNAMHLSPCPGQSHSDNDPTGVPKLVDSTEPDACLSGTKTLSHELYTHTHSSE